MTEKLAGVEISGDIYDLRQLVDAFYALCTDEDDKHSKFYTNMSDANFGKEGEP
ncbi:hypothetical protein AGMMS50276_18050 [Synergistales bacterium]|nr:hypothetical protein AGMMS50276_18050 [Synergistales bacterium]